jgi:hypothetical protein
MTGLGNTMKAAGHVSVWYQVCVLCVTLLCRVQGTCPTLYIRWWFVSEALHDQHDVVPRGRTNRIRYRMEALHFHHSPRCLVGTGSPPIEGFEHLLVNKTLDCMGTVMVLPAPDLRVNGTVIQSR